MTKLSIVASRVLVGFGVIALASTSSLGADVEVTNKADPAKSNIASAEIGAEVGADKDITAPEGTGFFTKTGNTYTFGNKKVDSNAVADFAKDDTLKLKLDSANELNAQTFTNDTNSRIVIHLPQDSTTKKNEGSIDITNEGSDGINLYNYDLSAKGVSATDVNLISNSGESKVVVKGVASTDKFAVSSTTALSDWSDIDLANQVGRIVLQNNGSLSVTGDFEADKTQFLFVSPTRANTIRVEGTADIKYTSGFTFASRNINDLVFKDYEILSSTEVINNNGTAVITGTEPQEWGSSFDQYAAVLIRDTQDVLGKSISKELLEVMNGDVSDQATIKYVNFAYRAATDTEALNGFYTSADGKKLLVSSELVRDANGIANINKLDTILTDTKTALDGYKTTLAAADLNTDINAKVTSANTLLKDIYDARDAAVTSAGGTASTAATDAERNTADRKAITDNIATKQTAVNTAQTTYNEAKAALDADPTNATKATALANADTALSAAKDNLTTAQGYLTTFDKNVALINEGKALWTQAGKMSENYADITNAANAKTYFKFAKDNAGAEYNTGKLTKAGIRKLVENVDVGSHRGLSVNIFDSLQESALSETTRATFNPMIGEIGKLKGFSNDMHNIARSVTNFTNSVSTAINVSNDMSLGDRIARAHNPYGEKLAAAGNSDVYNDFYRRTNGSIWVNAFGGANIVDSESGGVYGISLGADKQVGDSALVGIYFTYADADLKDKSVKQESDNFRLGIYSNIQIAPTWELNLHGFGQLAQTDQYASKIGENYSSDFDKKFFGLSGSIGKIIDFENSLYLKPFVGLNYYYSHTPSYTEKGGSLPVKANKMQNNSLSADVGLELRKYFNETSYLFATPKVEQYLLNDGDDYVASFVGSPANFSVSASDKLKTYGQVVVGGSFGITENLNLDLGFGAKQILANKVDDKNETYLSGNLGIRYKF